LRRRRKKGKKRGADRILRIHDNLVAVSVQRERERERERERKGSMSTKSRGDKVRREERQR